MREPGRGGGSVVAAAVAELEKQQALKGSSCNFPLRNSSSSEQASVKFKGPCLRSDPKKIEEVDKKTKESERGQETLLIHETSSLGRKSSNLRELENNCYETPIFGRNFQVQNNQSYSREKEEIGYEKYKQSDKNELYISNRNDQDLNGGIEKISCDVKKQALRCQKDQTLHSQQEHSLHTQQERYLHPQKEQTLNFQKEQSFNCQKEPSTVFHHEQSHSLKKLTPHNTNETFLNDLPLRNDKILRLKNDNSKENNQTHHLESHQHLETPLLSTKQMETGKQRSPTNILNTRTKNNICLGDFKEVRGAQSRVENTQALQFVQSDVKKRGDSFESAVRNFDLTAEDIRKCAFPNRGSFKPEFSVLKNNHQRGENCQNVEGLTAPKEFPPTISDDFGSDSSDDGTSSSETDSDSGKEIILNDGLETITEEDRITSSSVNSAGILCAKMYLEFYCFNASCF